MAWDFFWHFLFSSRAGSVVRRIAWLSFSALVVSVASLILVLSVMTSLNHHLQDRLLTVEPHLVIEAEKPLAAADWKAKETQLRDSGVVKAEWRSFSFEAQDVILRTVEGRFRGAEARGLTREGLLFILGEIARVNRTEPVGARTSPEVTEGKTLSEKQFLEAQEVMVGVDLSHILGVFEGDALTVVPPEGLLLPPGEAPKFEKVKVREIITTNLQKFDSQSMFYIAGESLPRLQASGSLRRGLEIWIPDPNQAAGIQRELRDRLAEQGLKISTWKDRNAALFLSLRLEKFVIGLFLSIASLVAGFSLIIVLGLLISQKQKEIGLLLSAGLSARSVGHLFQGIAMRLAGAGLFGGAFLGSALSLYLEYFPLKILPDIYYNSEIEASLDFSMVVIILTVGMLFSWAGSWVISRPLLRWSPTQLLRN